MSVESLASHQPLVLILMGTFNGEKYIREQLDSIASQTHQNWKLVISDDGSTDQTLEIAKKWASEVGVGRVEFRQGPKKGFAQNFLSMACDSSLKADFYAFCDQDDLWMPNKLEVALARLSDQDVTCEPALYCSRTQYFKERLELLGYSTLFTKPRSFKNALVQSLAGGNTMVFNQVLKSTLVGVGIVSTVSHDWWLYQLTTGMNGYVFYDKQVSVLYRQHSEALAGRNTGFSSIVKRLQMGFSGDFARYTDQTIMCLEQSGGSLTEVNRQTLAAFKRLRVASLFERTFGLIRLGLYRQTKVGQIGLIVLIVLKKI